jgi:hypothetical protein
MVWLWASERARCRTGSSLRAGQAGGDEVAAQGDAAGDGAFRRADDGAGGAEQVVGDRGEHGPGSVGAERAGGLAGQGPSMRSNQTCSQMAWSRWVMSAWSTGSVLLVKNGW